MGRIKANPFGVSVKRRNYPNGYSSLLICYLPPGESDSRKKKVRSTWLEYTKENLALVKRTIIPGIMTQLALGKDPYWVDDKPMLYPYLDKFIEICKKQAADPNHKMSENTYLAYLAFSKKIKALFKDRPIEEVKASDIQKLQAELEKNNVSSANLKAYLSPLSSAFELAAADDLPIRNPVKAASISRRGNNQELKKPRKAFTHEELITLFRGMENIDMKVFYTIMLTCGVRRGNAWGLKVEDIDFDNNTITFNRQIKETGIILKNKSKGKMTIISAMNENLKNLLLEYISLKNLESGDYVTARSKKGIPKDFIPELRKLLDKFEWEGFCGVNHEFRHTFLTQIAEAGLSPMSIKQAAGHSSFKSSEHYITKKVSKINNSEDLSKLEETMNYNFESE